MTRCIFDLESTGLLDELFNRIICICTYDIETKETKTFIGEDEGKILDDFFNYINLLKWPSLVGYNIDSFDIPFIIRRAVINKKRVPRFFNLDLRKIVNGFKYSYNKMEKGRLKDWAAVLGITVNSSPGSEMFKLYSEKRFDEIEAHCLEDIEITKKLYEHADAAGLVSN